MKRIPRFAIGLFTGLALGWLLSSVEWNSGSARSVLAVEQDAQLQLSPEEERNISIFEKASPSVVFITTLSGDRNPFRLDASTVRAGTGSGLVWDKEGHIITNFHLIRQANSAKVTLADQSSWPAELVGTDPDKDLAVLRIDAPAGPLHPLRIGSSGELRVGQSVSASGNPYGLDQTLTTGIISGLGREIQSITQRPIVDVIQTDAAINPGNSGGPLLDSAGRMIGINTAIFSPSGGSSGVGFAVTIDSVKRIVPQIIDNGHARRAGMGVVLGSDHVARQLGLEGIVITGIVPNTPAASAGFQPIRQDRRGRMHLGDIITKIDGDAVTTSNELYLKLDEYEPGDVVTVTVLRHTGPAEVNVELIDIASF